MNKLNEAIKKQVIIKIIRENDRVKCKRIIKDFLKNR